MLVVTHEHYDHVAGFALPEVVQLFCGDDDPSPAGRLASARSGSPGPRIPPTPSGASSARPAPTVWID